MIYHSLGNQKLIPYNSHKYIREGGRGLVVSESAKPYHMHKFNLITTTRLHSHILVSQSDPMPKSKGCSVGHCVQVTSSPYLTNNSSSFRTPSKPGLTLESNLALRTNTPCRNSPFASRLLLNSTFG